MVCGNQIYTNTRGLPNTRNVCCRSARALNGEKAAGAAWACPSEGKRQYTLKSYERGKGKRRT